MERGLWAQGTLHFLIPVARMGYTLHLISHLNCHHGWGEENGERFLNWLSINPKGPERKKTLKVSELARLSRNKNLKTKVSYM